MRSRVLRGLGIVVLLPIFGLTFWAAATLASSLPGLLAVAVNVHGFGLVSYAGDSGHRPAPLSFQVLEDAQRDASRGGPSTEDSIATTTTPTSARPTPTPLATPTPAPLPVSMPPLPAPTPAPLPTPTPAPGLLPLPLPLPVPILPSLQPGLLK